MTHFDLNEDNFLLFAIKHYDNPECSSMKDFEEDLSICVYIKRLLRKYNKTGVLKERLILNHIITFYNLFGIDAATKILLYKIDSDLHSILKPFLFFLNYISYIEKSHKKNPDFQYLLGVDMDEKVIQILRKL